MPVIFEGYPSEKRESMYKIIDKLYSQSKRGDKNSKEELLTRLRPLILTSIRKYYNKRNMYDDLIQEGYIVVLQAIEDYDESRGTNFLGYVKMHLRFYYLNMNRKVKHSISLNIFTGKNDSIELIDMIADGGVNVDDIVLKKESLQELWTSLSSLAKRQKEVIYLFYIENMSMVEISKKLQISYRTVVNTKTKAIKNLKSRI